MANELAAGRPRVELDTPLGRVRGYERIGAHTFLGLPYASFTGRFRPAAPATSWRGTRDATDHAAGCPQPPPRPDGPAMPRRGPYDDDCLYLNVHVPSDAGEHPKPVIVWIHGGGFTHGSANETDGSALAVTADAVVVCINYRLGLLGWLDLSCLGPDYAESADVWLTDQVAALQWVRDNIASFGGDPSRVTIVGESAGGAAVLALCSIERARGLFHRAVASSPPIFPDVPRPDLLAKIARKRRSTREQAAHWLLTTRAEDVVALGSVGAPPWYCSGPVLDRPVPDGIRAKGRDAVPLVVGFNSDEGDPAASGPRSWLSRGPMGWFLTALMLRAVRPLAAGGPVDAPGYARRLRAHYGVNGLDLFGAMFLDVFRRPSVASALATTRAGSCGFLYELDVPCRLNGTSVGSVHTADVPLTFNAFADPEGWPPPLILDFETAPRLAERWVAALATFARSGDPSGPLGEWPVYDTPERRSLLVTPEGGSVVQDRDRTHRVLVWGEKEDLPRGATPST